jgi:hypothetical protein
MSFFRHVAQLQIDYSKWSHWEAAAIHAGFRWMHSRFCIVSDRPERLLVDERNRPHCADGPSHQWWDGWKLYYWHGVRVPERVIMAPESYTPDELRQLNSDNTEQFRALAERLSWTRTLEKLGSKSVNTWDDADTGLRYELHEAQLGGEAARFIAKQSSVLKDGSQPRYMESVPALCETAQSARKWQAMAAYLSEGDTQGAMELARHCNAHPELRYDWEA